MTGYQQAILMLLGVDTGGKFLVRCIDRWYIDSVAELFPTAPYLQRRADGKKDYWVVKSAQVHLLPSLADVTDWQGFCRGAVELQACLDRWPHKTKRGVPIATPADLRATRAFDADCPAPARSAEKTAILAYANWRDVRAVLPEPCGGR